MSCILYGWESGSSVAARKLFRMLRDLVLSSLPSLHSWWCHSSPRFAELALWTLVVFWVGFWCGAVLTGFCVSTRCRQWAVRLLISALEGQVGDPGPVQAAPRNGRNRLLAYRG